MMNLKKAATLCGVCLTALLAGCSPTPLSDHQLEKIIEHCKSQGLAIYAFNSVLVSRAECIPVTYASEHQMTPFDYYRTLTSLRNAHSETQRKEILQDVLVRYGTQTYQQMVKALEVRRQRV